MFSEVPTWGRWILALVGAALGAFPGILVRLVSVSPDAVTSAWWLKLAVAVVLIVGGSALVVRFLKHPVPLLLGGLAAGAVATLGLGLLGG